MQKNLKVMSIISENKEFTDDLNRLGITGEKEQEEILEYFFNIGKIIYNFKIKDYGKEN